MDKNRMRIIRCDGEMCCVRVFVLFFFCYWTQRSCVFVTKTNVAVESHLGEVLRAALWKTNTGALKLKWMSLCIMYWVFVFFETQPLSNGSYSISYFFCSLIRVNRDLRTRLPRRTNYTVWYMIDDCFNAFLTSSQAIVFEMMYRLQHTLSVSW